MLVCPDVILQQGGTTLKGHWFPPLHRHCYSMTVDVDIKPHLKYSFYRSELEYDRNEEWCENLWFLLQW